MTKRILITGGAGFLGSYLAEELLKQGYHVRVFDNLSSLVHGIKKQPPAYLSPEVEFIQGDLQNRDAVCRALEGVDVVFHFAALVGSRQSMYDFSAYTAVNTMGTATLLEALVVQPVEKLIVASSASVYGADRARLPVQIPETQPPSPASIYALSKYDQERMCLMIGSAYKFSVTALRFFNVYGPRQSAASPYTGLIDMFAARLLNNLPPLIFEDGRLTDDYVSVHDAVEACCLALETPEAAGEVFNIGSGTALSAFDLAAEMAHALCKSTIEPQMNVRYRSFDGRCADISKARKMLGYKPRVALEDGLAEFAEWIARGTTKRRKALVMP